MHFYTVPGLLRKAVFEYAAEYCEDEDGDGMFKKCRDCDKCPNKFRLELLTDIDMLLMFEKSITQAAKRYAKANNKYMSEYDAEL